MIFKIFDKLESGIFGMMRTNVKMKKKKRKISGNPKGKYSVNTDCY